MDFSTDKVPNLSNRVAIVTGGSDGIGYEVSRKLAVAKARVYILSRNEKKATEAITRMKKSTVEAKDINVNFIQVDLQSLASVKAAAEEFTRRESRLSLLINNAAIMAVPLALTVDGFETQWQTNYLSPFYLTKLLLPTLSSTLSETDDSNELGVRIINVSADAAVAPFAPNLDLENPNLEKVTSFTAPWQRYCHSKVALNLLTHHLSTLSITTKTDKADTPSPRIKVYAVHPGIIQTNLLAADPTLLGSILRFAVNWGLVPGKTSREGAAEGVLACALGTEAAIANGSGGYFTPIGKRSYKGDALVQRYEMDGMGQRLWEASERMVRSKGFEV